MHERPFLCLIQRITRIVQHVAVEGLDGGDRAAEKVEGALATRALPEFRKRAIRRARNLHGNIFFPDG
jgi:hypothetical protein